MATISDHLDRVRAKPHAERRRIAFLSSLLITGVIAFGWMGAMASSGTLTLAPTPGGDPLSQEDGFGDAKSNFSTLLGAAGAAVGASSSPASIIVVDGATYSTLDTAPTSYNNTSETVITF